MMQFDCRHEDVLFRFRALRKKTVGDYFFKETEDLVEKLCDDFEVTVNLLSKSENQLN
jgi:hypothetical protein